MTCKYPTCNRDPGSADTDRTYRDGRFCSPKCELKYEHVKADAQDARRQEQRERHHDDAPRHGGRF